MQPAGYYTSPFKSSAILVIDAIGEWTTTSIWENMECIWTSRYPNSLGLFYSAMTDRIGLKANEDEYILMGMAFMVTLIDFIMILKDY